MHALHARLPKNFVLEERLERYADSIEASPERWAGQWAEACHPLDASCDRTSFDEVSPMPRRRPRSRGSTTSSSPPAWRTR